MGKLHNNWTYAFADSEYSEIHCYENLNSVTPAISNPPYLPTRSSQICKNQNDDDQDQQQPNGGHQEVERIHSGPSNSNSSTSSNSSNTVMLVLPTRPLQSHPQPQSGLQHLGVRRTIPLTATMKQTSMRATNQSLGMWLFRDQIWITLHQKK